MAIKQWVVCGVIVTAATFAATASAETTDTPAPDIYSIEYVQANLVTGQTTKQQVLQSFGEPASKSAKLSSSGGASETFVYMKNAPKKAAKAKGGFGSMVSSLRGVATGVAHVAGSSIPGGAYAASYLAQNSVNAVNSVRSVAGAGQQAELASGGASTLVVQFQGGVVSYFNME